MEWHAGIFFAWAPAGLTDFLNAHLYSRASLKWMFSRMWGSLWNWVYGGTRRPMGSLFLRHWLGEAGDAVIKGVMLYEYQICMRDMQRTRTYHTHAFLDETQATRDTRPLFTWSLFPPGNLGSLLMNKCMGCWKGIALLLWVTLDDTEPSGGTHLYRIRHWKRWKSGSKWCVSFS